MDIIKFFRSLNPDDWSKKVTERWTVKDVLSHLIGWDREVVIELRNTFQKETEPSKCRETRKICRRSKSILVRGRHVS
ncbi:MAG: hypothetical protein A3I26_03725 [Candidatus Yanofskybacteria bacterium RIFCSPLOWO2_02_FULL_43_10]|uniref:Mycothiol-dependent maleylpyruvate isomerase metal-binding domain-containing protein n=1 Tax=Candidatus Yanofskybacteria bacterium RIFCSPLOWO2_12_FULL_43_11b TaxID=1802710 RepID=A0A1F8H9S9_9BACT|nr:MAG: hypothetical protein A2742_02280 [Candidatus Yanofskybacteria bacterium RIFCSPHIGHO2_01_FULL_43_32]OGN11523.1 MAG: hypothetical protein A3C69_03620 [Candidatus Yanofskybacteria bacterium RIFCSPHIGHO2_02_FULL_43_12]OGN18396.1 MAG: hypothetical protein A3E34_00910 [Candidatus Yanofskybacteria bacterium RIFCSPHIGHO2_12_FULL_43_11]OGN24859.1 MAG: hypothetical protein A2923_01100 [Candidatus Yanofskybacteria bacterium RIFCSPLOWO2_01_FULL_43_46]OGN29609.1 MAG: hypothetical protein A3I26_03725